MNYLIIQGIVSKGLGKGKKIGFPTLNLSVKKNLDLVKITGVWVSFVLYDNKKLFSVTHIGKVKIYGIQNIRMETHILNWDADLYGKEIQVKLLKKIRESKDFDNEQDLIKQIKEDINSTREYLKNYINE